MREEGGHVHFDAAHWPGLVVELLPAEPLEIVGAVILTHYEAIDEGLLYRRDPGPLYPEAVVCLPGDVEHCVLGVRVVVDALFLYVVVELPQTPFELGRSLLAEVELASVGEKEERVGLR